MCKWLSCAYLRFLTKACIGYYLSVTGSQDIDKATSLILTVRTISTGDVQKIVIVPSKHSKIEFALLISRPLKCMATTGNLVFCYHTGKKLHGDGKYHRRVAAAAHSISLSDANGSQKQYKHLKKFAQDDG